VYIKEDLFACTCGCGTNQIDTGFITILAGVRENSGIPFHVELGYICENHTYSGRHYASHRRGKACSLKVPNDKNRYDIILALVQHRFSRIGVYGDLLYVDIDNEETQGVFMC
jgi:hypothetical protein